MKIYISLKILKRHTWYIIGTLETYVVIKINLSNFPLYLYSNSPGAYGISITLYYINTIGVVELERVEYRLLSSSVSKKKKKKKKKKSSTD